MFNYKEYTIIQENYNQLKSIIKSKGSSKNVDKGFGTPEGVEKGSDDYQFLATLISPDENYKSSTTIPLYGEIPVNPEKEKTLRPFLGMLAKMYYEENCDLSIINDISNWILTNKNHLNRLILTDNNTNTEYPLSNILDIFKYKQQFNDGRPAYEILTDAIINKGGADDVKEWINRFPSVLKNEFKNKDYYQDLSDMIKSFKSLSKNGQNSVLRTFFGDSNNSGKISRFDKAPNFLKFLETEIKNNLSGFNIDVIKKLISNTKGAKLIVEDVEKNYLIADIWCYKASQILGEPNNWCISYGQTYWDNTYMNYDSGNKMYFIWNFNREMSDKYSHLGLCISGYGQDNPENIKVRAFHDKYDKAITLSVLDDLDIDYKFIYKQEITEEEYNFKSFEYKKNNILNEFNRYRELDNSLKNNVSDVIEFYKSGEITDEDIKDLWSRIFNLYIDDSFYYCVTEILDNIDLKPYNISNNILYAFLSRIDRRIINFTNLPKYIDKLFSIYSFSTHNLSKEILTYLKENNKSVYDFYYNNIKKGMMNYSDDSETDFNIYTILNDLESFLEDYDILLNYIIKSSNVSKCLIPVYNLKNTFISDLVKKGYKFNIDDIYVILQNIDYDLSSLPILNDDVIDTLLIRIVRYLTICKNINNLIDLFKKYDIDLLNVYDDVRQLEFLLVNNINIDDINYTLDMKYDDVRKFLDTKYKIINIYKDFKKGKIIIGDDDINKDVKSFYNKHIIKYIFENDLPIEKTTVFIESFLYRNIDNTPIKYIKDIIDLILSFNMQIDSKLAKLALDNNIYENKNIIIDNLEYDENSEYGYSSKNTEIIKVILADETDESIIDSIISKLPNLENYDMDDVGIYIKNVKTINKLLDICKTPNKYLLYYIFNYGYSKDNKIGDIGDNEETLRLIDRLIDLGYKFETSKNSFRNFYDIVEMISFYIFKYIIDNNYINISDLDVDKICKNILKNNDVDIYNFIKPLLPNKSFLLSQLPNNPKKEIVDDILKTDSEDFMYLFSKIKNNKDFIYYYDKFYDSMDDRDKKRIIHILLHSYYSSDIEKPLVILDYLTSNEKYKDNKRFVEMDWDENKRRKNYNDETRQWIKNFINPPKTKVKKIKEMFNLNFNYKIKRY